MIRKSELLIRILYKFRLKPMLLSLLLFSSIIFASSCFGLTEIDCDPKELEIAFASDSAHFKKEVIDTMPSYILLKDFILKNLGEILSHRDKKSFMVTQHEDGTQDTTPFKKDYYAFHNYGKGNEIKDQVPAHLYPELMAIYANFNNDNFQAVTFYRDSSVSISVTNPSEYNEKGIGINHGLAWRNPKYDVIKDSSSLVRDTIMQGAVYTVFIDCYRGW